MLTFERALFSLQARTGGRNNHLVGIEGIHPKWFIEDEFVISVQINSVPADFFGNEFDFSVCFVYSYHRCRQFVLVRA